MIPNHTSQKHNKTINPSFRVETHLDNNLAAIPFIRTLAAAYLIKNSTKQKTRLHKVITMACMYNAKVGFEYMKLHLIEIT